MVPATVHDKLAAKRDALIASVQAQTAEEIAKLRSDFEEMAKAFVAESTGSAAGTVAAATAWTMTLRVLEGPHAGLAATGLVLREGEPVRLGRSFKFSVGGLSLPNDSSVSEEHAQIAFDAARGVATFTDDSSNGSCVDGVEVGRGSSVELGRTSEFVLGNGDDGVLPTKVSCTVSAPIAAAH